MQGMHNFTYAARTKLTYSVQIYDAECQIGQGLYQVEVLLLIGHSKQSMNVHRINFQVYESRALGISITRK